MRLEHVRPDQLLVTRCLRERLRSDPCASPNTSRSGWATMLE